MVNIGKQKESLERTLQSKIKYIRVSEEWAVSMVAVVTRCPPSSTGYDLNWVQARGG